MSKRCLHANNIHCDVCELEALLAAAQAQRDELTNVLRAAGWATGEIDSAAETIHKAEAQRDKALVALNAIKEYWNENINDRAMFDACWFAKNTAEAVLKECWKVEKTAAVVFKQTKSGYAMKVEK